MMTEREKRRIAKKWALFDAALALQSHMESGCLWALMTDDESVSDAEHAALVLVEEAIQELINELMRRSDGHLGPAATLAALCDKKD